MMSATPIFEQLCRDFHDAANAHPVDASQPLIVSQRKGPAHSLEDTGSGLAYVGGCAPVATAQPPPPLEWRLIDGSRRRRYVIVLCIGGLPTGSASRGGLDLSCRSITYSRPEMLAPQPIVRMS
jgi:hypothetical protein